jgi:class 3 adenylate cyclase
LIDQSTRDALGELIVTEPASSMRLKGFTEPVAVHKLLAIRDQATEAYADSNAPLLSLSASGPKLGDVS